MGKKSKYGDNRLLAKFVPEGPQTGCFLYHLVWARRWVPLERYIRAKACNLDFEIHTCSSYIASIAGRNPKLRIYGYILLKCLLVVGFLVDNQNIFALEPYRPVAVWIGGETMTRDVIFFYSS
jgi:hypothetical protein